MSIKPPDSSERPFEIGRPSPYESKDPISSSKTDPKSKHKVKESKQEKLNLVAKERMSPQKERKEKRTPEKSRFSKVDASRSDSESPVKKRLFVKPDSTENVDKKIPSLPSALKTDIKDYAKLFHASRELTKSTKDHLLNPKKGDHANEVYITKPNAEIGGVVFKTNPVAEKAVACAGLARLVGLGKSLPPAKISNASVSMNMQYMRLSVKGSRDILVEPEALEKVENVKRDGRGITCETASVNIKLIPEGDAFIAEIQSFEDEEESESSFEKAIKTGQNFVKLTDEEEMSFLAPETEIFDIKTNKGKEYVTIDKFVYLVNQDEDGSITLTIPKIKQKENVEPNEALLEVGVMIKLNAEDEEDPEELSEVLSFANSVLSVDLEDETNINFTHEGKDYNAEIKDGKYLISKVESTLNEDDDDEISFDEQGRKILSTTEKEALGEDDFPFDENDKLQLCHDDKGTYYLASLEDSLPIQSEGGNEFVNIEGKKYAPRLTKKGRVEIVGHSVRGMVQSLVSNTFTHPAGTKDLNITHPSPAREAFFHRIDMPSFIDSFILTILIRPQDGKIINLEQSNVLFQAIEDELGNDDPLDPNVKLRPVLIDLDETLPEKNGYSIDKQFTDDGLRDVHSVRCGLMGFPQARKKLSSKEKKHAIEVLKNITKNQESLRQYLSKFGQKNINSVESTMEIIDKINEFLSPSNQKDWTLEDLFFAVIPGYKTQWDMLGLDLDPALKASRIGLESEKTFAPKTVEKHSQIDPLKIHIPGKKKTES